MERRRADANGRRRRSRSRSFSPVASRLRYHLRRRHTRPPPVPSSHRRRRRKDEDKNGKRSRSRSHHGSRSRRRTDSRAPRSRSRSRSGSRKRRHSGTRSRTGSNGHHRRYRGRKRSSRTDSQTRRRSPENDYNSRRRGNKQRYSRRRDSYHDREPLPPPPAQKDGSEDSVAHDDTVGSYAGKPGEYIANRYKIIREAGLGTFGRVLECLDKQRNFVVAIKVVRKVDKYTESAKIEAAILEDVNDKDKNNESLCVRMFKWFEHKGHVCMVFERLGCSLYDYLKNHDYKPFPLHCIRAYAWQLLTSLEFIHSIRLIHTDLKPENILLVDDEEERRSSDCSSPSSTSSYGSPDGSTGREQWSNGRQWKKRKGAMSDVDSGRLSLHPPANNAVKLIDFGGATYEDESKSSIINTRQYRSPEVILGLGWSYPSDIWSAGCIIAELYLGELLFATHENMEHLALIEKCFGPLPAKMAAQASKNSSSSKFFHHGRLNWPAGASNDESVDHVRRMRLLADLISREDAQSGLLELLQLMLVLDPENRVTAKEALNTPFFDGFSYRNIARTGRSDGSLGH
ncbi:CMGC/CLK protein kinase [Phytophthora megakarya]|uniref:CMGC/CLK protein kinase n=1 Tax=Phytophthora megakarya TaxID=4795 RepID=A0A225WAS6_9STRA|nr:CMGC/CLK protein kinase [Phytophthora megakarya]